MTNHRVCVHPSTDKLPKEQQLAWKLASVAANKAELNDEANQMLINRVIDNYAVAIASLNRLPPAVARAQALGHQRQAGAAIYGLPASSRVAAQWAAWANGTAVRELDMHDTFLAADYSHPADNIPPILAVAQQCGANGEEFIRACLLAYEIHIALVRGICLHKHAVDHIAHLAPAQTAGIACLLGLNCEVTYQAIQQALHTAISSRQSRKGEISSWKAFAPAHAGKIAVESVDRAMRGLTSPSPIYEGEDSVIASFLDGKEASYEISLPEPGEPHIAILESYTKEHSAEYQAQAFIDLAFKMKKKIDDTSHIIAIDIYTSHHTHKVIGTGANDPQKFDPKASRETLDHSLMYIFAVALQDGVWHHIDSYTPERAQRSDTVALWHKIKTHEDKSWSKAYHNPTPAQRHFGGRAEIRLNNGLIINEELHRANAHPQGAKPFIRTDYAKKFFDLTDGAIKKINQTKYLSALENLGKFSKEELANFNIEVDAKVLANTPSIPRGIFDAIV